MSVNANPTPDNTFIGYEYRDSVGVGVGICSRNPLDLYGYITRFMLY